MVGSLILPSTGLVAYDFDGVFFDGFFKVRMTTVKARNVAELASVGTAVGELNGSFP
jgi:hypothetical protein